jgi:hypothetical protein
VAAEFIEWRDFFSTTATIAGALIGLLFVAVSLHLRLIAEDEHADLRLDAQSNLIAYVLAMAFSLVPLIPQSYHALGAEFLVTSALLFIIFVRISLLQLRRHTRAYDRRTVWFLTLLRASTVASCAVGGAGVLADQPWPPYLLAVGVSLLLTASVFRTWGLIFRAARVDSL